MVFTQAPTKPAPYAGTGQGRDRRRRRRRSTRRVVVWRLEILAGSLLMAAVVCALTVWPATAPPRRMPPGIALVQSGLLTADPFHHATPSRDLLDRYAFNGSAGPGLGWVQATGGGLDVGVRAHRGWAGWFAVTIHATGVASVWHVDMSRPSTPSTHGLGEAVLAVQSASTQRNSSINYVVVSTLVGGGQSVWQVGSAHGFTADAVTHVLWRERGPDTPSGYPITVRTDGRHYLEVWLGNRLVFASHRLHMHDPPPFQTYLEVQGKDSAYVSHFTNFWIAQGAPVTVTGVPRGALVELRSGHRVTSGVADRSGRATLSIPPPEAVGSGTLLVRVGSVLHRYPGLDYAGGDVLRVGDA